MATHKPASKRTPFKRPIFKTFKNKKENHQDMHNAKSENESEETEVTSLEEIVVRNCISN